LRSACLSFQRRSQTFQAAADVAAHRRRRAPRRVGDLLVVQPHHVPEDDGPALGRRRRPESVVPGRLVGGLRVLHPEAVLEANRGGPAGLVPGVVAAEVEGDRPHPGSQPQVADPLGVVFAERPIGADECLLGQVLGVVGAGEPPQARIHVRGQSVDEPGECAVELHGESAAQFVHHQSEPHRPRVCCTHPTANERRSTATATTTSAPPARSSGRVAHRTALPSRGTIASRAADSVAWSLSVALPNRSRVRARFPDGHTRRSTRLTIEPATGPRTMPRTGSLLSVTRTRAGTAATTTMPRAASEAETCRSTAAMSAATRSASRADTSKTRSTSVGMRRRSRRAKTASATPRPPTTPEITMPVLASDSAPEVEAATIATAATATPTARETAASLTIAHRPDQPVIVSTNSASA